LRTETVLSLLATLLCFSSKFLCVGIHGNRDNASKSLLVRGACAAFITNSLY
jgi:hypothetical protein